jgi:hypothetical protein
VSLSEPHNDQELEALLTETFGPPPRADIDAWRKRYPRALAWLNPERISVFSQRRRRMQRITILAGAMAAAICLWLGLSHFDGNDRGASAFAQTVAQIRKAKTVTWKQTEYSRATTAKGADDKKTWLISNTICHFYKSPGLSRAEHPAGTPILIDDSANGKYLSLDATKKHAVIMEFRPSTTFPVPVLGWVSKALSKPDLQWVEKRTTRTREVNIFRYAEKDEFSHRNRSTDLWIDAKTKQLVEVHMPGADIFDTERDPLRDNPPGGQGFSVEPMGTVLHDIIIDAELNDSLFSLRPPEGYTVEVRSRHVMTEREMIDYLDAVTDFNDRTFPDQIYPRIYAPRFNSTHLNEVNRKSENDRTAAEKKFMQATQHRYFQGEALAIDRFGYFIHDSVLPDTFRYLGKGVKLGDKDRIVCWYKLKNAKDPSTYRVVYGDLSVKDVAAKDLPLPVEP